MPTVVLELVEGTAAVIVTVPAGIVVVVVVVVGVGVVGVVVVVSVVGVVVVVSVVGVVGVVVVVSVVVGVCVVVASTNGGVGNAIGGTHTVTANVSATRFAPAARSHVVVVVIAPRLPQLQVAPIVVPVAAPRPRGWALQLVGQMPLGSAAR